MTELTCLATMPQPGVLGPWDSVGKPLAGNAIKIFNDMGVEVPEGEVGEIYVSGKGNEQLSTSPT
jgi:acyl-coenzyme A synthetase/AMP-(fatty) acid ligase